MNKSGLAALAAALSLTACTTTPPVAPPPPVVAVVKDKELFPPRPLTLLYTTFQDHAVLQREKPLPIWGKTTPSATVEITFAGQSASATADTNGHWQVTLPAMKAGGPYTLSAKSSSGETQILNDIMVGDVYLCSGQSNMEMPLRLATNYDSELRAAFKPKLRLFRVQRFSSPAPHETFGADASWAVTTPDTAKEFSATCYYFGANLQPAAGVSVGLIEDAWGGSAIQAWVSNDKIASLGAYSEMLNLVKAYAVAPKEADLKYRNIVHHWFDANDPTMKAKPAWFEPTLDDTAWDDAILPGGWRPWPKLAKFEGIVWWRKTIELTAAEAEGQAALTLGQVSNFDLTFVNGTEVGAGEAYDVVRNYTVPAGILHEGKNVIAVGIEMGGSFLDPAEKFGLKLANGAVKPLTGPWKWKTSVSAAHLPQLPHQPWLNQFGLSTLYNGMIEPLGATQIRGIVWYQGETDAGQPKEYGRLLPALIQDWRTKFGADTPFYVVQLPGFGPATSKPGHSDWAALRDVQRKVVEATPNTGIAVTTDLGAPDNIHPQQKQEVGRRLSLLARKFIYGENITAQSPTPLSATRHAKAVTVIFDNIGKGLEVREWERAVGFTLCEEADQCSFVDGYVSGNTVKLDASKHPKATSVRFCWADSPMCNLVNSDGLPATPFEIPITAEKKTAKKP